MLKIFNSCRRMQFMKLGGGGYFYQEARASEFTDQGDEL